MTYIYIYIYITYTIHSIKQWTNWE